MDGLRRSISPRKTSFSKPPQRRGVFRLPVHPKSFGVIAAILFVPVFGFFLWKIGSTPEFIADYAADFGNAGEAVAADLSHLPSLPIEKEGNRFVIRDTSESGIRIMRGGEEEKPPEEYQQVFLPEDYREAIEISLPNGQMIRMRDEGNAGRFSSDILNSAPQNEEGESFWKQIFATTAQGKPSYVRYQSGRKSILYTYQKDGATGERLLKQWTLYEEGNGTEKESYTFENAKLKLLDDGRVGVYYYGEQELQNEQAAADVPKDLMDRAARVLERDLAKSVTSGEPDVIIPRPYFYDKDGTYHEAKWSVEESRLTVDFEASEDSYPLALDPTLQFTAPGSNNSGATISGEASSSNFGASMIGGDFNADGRTDLAVGAYQYSSSTGRAYIFFNDGGYSANATVADLTITGEGTSNSFGYSLASGDFNADGRTDLAVGAYQYSSSTGRAYIFYNDGSIPTTAGTADVTITGEGTSNSFGYSLASGDFNADGRTDLAVGAYQYSSNTGRAYIFYNDGSIPTTAGTADVTITGEGPINSFGRVLAPGDFNADGRTDLAVGAYQYSSSTGRAYIFYNDGSIPTTAGTADLTITGEGTSNFFGRALASGDFNADGRTDLAVGASSYSFSTGRAYMFYSQNGQMNTNISIADESGSSSLGAALATGDFNADGRIDLAVGAPDYTADGGGTYAGRVYLFYGTDFPSGAAEADAIITGDAEFALFGSSVVAGDFNADGKTDIAASAPEYADVHFFYNDGSYPTDPTGADHTISGDYYDGWNMVAGDFNADGKTDLAVGTLNTQVFIYYNDGSYPASNMSADVLIHDTAGHDNFSVGMAAGDFNADGKTDLALGSYDMDGSNGRVYLLYNDGSYPTGTSSADVTITSANSESMFGDAIASGDLNSDGRTDLIVGEPYYSTGTGRAYVFYNDGSYPSDQTGADATFTGESSSTRFGISLATGDFNADGKTDLAVGANQYSSYTGRAYLFYNKGAHSESAANADVVITGSGTNSHFGKRLTAGDMNADGRTDLVVGSGTVGFQVNGGVHIYETRDNYVWELQEQAGSSRISPNSAGQELRITGPASSQFARSIAVGDFNADGKMDLAVGSDAENSSAGKVYIFFNDGSYATSSAGADIVINGEAASNYFGINMAAGDFNADGRTDVVVSATGYSSNTGRVYIFYNDGSYPSSAASADAIITGAGTSDTFGQSLAVGDLNADGKVDLIAASILEPAVYIFHNDGSYPSGAGSADVTITGSTSFFGQSLVTGDFNADGKTDLAATANALFGSGTAVIFYNDGSIPTTSGTADVTITGESVAISSLTAGDFNADGKIDLAAGSIAASTNAGRVYIFHNDGSYPSGAGSADVIITGQTSSQFGISLASGDFNADGRTDLAASSTALASSTGGVYLFYNDGSIPTTAATADLTLSGEETSSVYGEVLVSGDLNADGKADLVVGASQYGTASNIGRVYLYTFNDSTGTGDTSSNFGYAMAVGDFNRDGKDDLAVGAPGYSSNAGRVYLFYQKSGKVTVNASGADVTITGGSSQKLGGGIAVGDFDSDGDDDLWVSSNVGSSGGELYLFYQDGSWPSASSGADVTMNNAGYYNQTNQGLAVGDFNADGKDDLAVGTMDSSGSSSHVSLFYQDGSWPTDITSEDVDIAGGQADSAYSLAVGDFNKDGKDDIAAGGAGFNGVSDRSLRIYYQDGTWPTTPANADVTITSSGSLGFSGYLASGDFDADGDDDLVAGGHANSSSIYLFYQDGSWPASAAAADLEITGSSKVWPLAADLNADGRTDIATGDWEDGLGAGRVAILHNDGSYPTAITSADRLILGEGGLNFGTALASGDFNSDGRADLVIGNRGYSSSAGRVNVILTETKALNASQTPTEAAELKGSFKLKGNFRLK